MSDNGKILAVIEPDNHPYGVISRAAWLAQLTDCTLELLLCDPDISAMQHGFFVSNEARDIGEKIRAAQKEIIDELAQEARDKGIPVVTDVLEGRPIADGVMQRAMEMNPRYVIKGTEYHSVAERSIFIDTDWQLIRTCPFPLWLVKPHEMRDKPVILAAVDPVHSHDKPAALDQVIVDNAKVVAAASDGEIHLLHVYQRIAGIGREATKTFKPIQLPIDELSEKIKQEHREKLDALAEANGIDAEHTHQLPGSARELLPAFSRSYKTDLVVLGSLARWGLKKMILGSTAEKVLDKLPCDILIVRVQYQE